MWKPILLLREMGSAGIARQSWLHINILKFLSLNLYTFCIILHNVFLFNLKYYFPSKTIQLNVCLRTCFLFFFFFNSCGPYFVFLIQLGKNSSEKMLQISEFPSPHWWGVVKTYGFSLQIYINRFAISVEFHTYLVTDRKKFRQ